MPASLSGTQGALTVWPTEGYARRPSLKQGRDRAVELERKLGEFGSGWHSSQAALQTWCTFHADLVNALWPSTYEPVLPA